MPTNFWVKIRQTNNEQEPTKGKCLRKEKVFKGRKKETKKQREKSNREKKEIFVKFFKSSFGSVLVCRCWKQTIEQFWNKRKKEKKENEKAKYSVKHEEKEKES